MGIRFLLVQFLRHIVVIRIWKSGLWTEGILGGIWHFSLSVLLHREVFYNEQHEEAQDYGWEKLHQLEDWVQRYYDVRTYEGVLVGVHGSLDKKEHEKERHVKRLKKQNDYNCAEKTLTFP